MGLFDAMTNHAHKSELRESKDEIVCGELIRGLSHQGWRCYRVVGDSGRQSIGFKIPGDPVLSAVYIVVDRKTGSGRSQRPWARAPRWGLPPRCATKCPTRTTWR